MARKTKILRKKAARHAKKYPEYDMQAIKNLLDTLVSYGTNELDHDPYYKELSKDDKYWYIRRIELLGEEVKDAIDAILDEAVRLQDIARIATNEAIQSNIEATMYKNMLGEKEKDISSVARTMKNSLYNRIKNGEK